MGIGWEKKHLDEMLIQSVTLATLKGQFHHYSVNLNCTYL